MMKADRLGILSALFASVCCLGPVLLVLLGLGSLGFGALIGRYHWWFIGAAIVLLTIAWRSYLKEARRCKTASCEMARGKTTRTVLLLASVVVAVFVGLNLYTYASQTHQTSSLGTVPRPGQLASVVIPVEGMTCFTCELTVESSLNKLPGVQSADAKVTEQAAYVRYDPARVSLEALIAAINKTGYKA
ncbi:MAG: heavy-metal-associated domain-containing protein, partial [Candidatus Omnitrophica bacterium]|nr:heavy-metal-associated domain-containing protein [Candidatus Omnitrophota bacterium]